MGVQTTLNARLPVFTRGDTYDWTIPVYNTDGTLYDFTQHEGSGKGVRGQIRIGDVEGTSIGAVSWTTHGTDAAVPLGYARVKVTSTVADNAVPGYLWWDLEAYDSNQSPIVRTTLVQGRMRCVGDVTRL